MKVLLVSGRKLLSSGMCVFVGARMTARMLLYLICLHVCLLVFSFTCPLVCMPDYDCGCMSV